jgi:hypothetical protein
MLIGSSAYTEVLGGIRGLDTDHDSKSCCINAHSSDSVARRKPLTRSPEMEARNWRRRRLHGSVRAQAQPVAKSRHRVTTLLQLEFAVSDFRVQLFALSHAQGLRFKIASCQLPAALVQCHRGRPHKPLLQDANATKTPLVKILPIAYEVRCIGKREFLFEGLHCIDEDLSVFQDFRVIASEVNIDASPAQLPV